MIKRIEVSRHDIDASLEEIAQILYQDAPPSIQREKIGDARFQDALARARDVYFPSLQPVAFVKAMDVNMIRGIFAESLPPQSPIYRAVAHWPGAAAFVVSIGPHLENSITSLQVQGKLFEALFVDACGSVLADGLARLVMERWAAGQKKGGNVFPTRYSPGYCQWNVSGQVALFGYMADGDMPVTLTPANMMHPRKSISGLLVLEEKSPRSSLVAACRECGQKCRLARTLVAIDSGL